MFIFKYRGFESLPLRSSLRTWGKKRFRFCGKEKDNESGLYYYGLRYYAAWTCRFISVDPLAGKYPFYTPYQYAGNKPINFIDLDGKEIYPGKQLQEEGDYIANPIKKIIFQSQSEEYNYFFVNKYMSSFFENEKKLMIGYFSYGSVETDDKLFKEKLGDNHFAVGNYNFNEFSNNSNSTVAQQKYVGENTHQILFNALKTKKYFPKNDGAGNYIVYQYKEIFYVATFLHEVLHAFFETQDGNVIEHKKMNDIELFNSFVKFLMNYQEKNNLENPLSKPQMQAMVMFINCGGLSNNWYMKHFGDEKYNGEYDEALKVFTKTFRGEKDHSLLVIDHVEIISGEDFNNLTKVLDIVNEEFGAPYTL
jgi:RHS repeat-associated protein